MTKYNNDTFITIILSGLKVEPMALTLDLVLILVQLIMAITQKHTIYIFIIICRNIKVYINNK